LVNVHIHQFQPGGAVVDAAALDAVAQMVLSQELPDILGGVQLGRIGWHVK
jgi:hypothetical protein